MEEAVFNDSFYFRIRNILNLNYRSFVAFGFFALSIFALTVILSVSYAVAQSDRCLGGLCLKNAHSAFPVLKSLDDSFDPCYDFYSFCCGKWQDNESSLSDSTIVTTFNLLQEDIDCKLQDTLENISPIDKLPIIVQGAVVFYRSCIQPIQGSAKALKPILRLFEYIGGWPFIDLKTWNEDNFSWSEASAKTLQVLGIHTFIGFYISIDDENTTDNILLIGQPVLPEESLADDSVISMLYTVIKTLNSHNLNDTEILVEIYDICAFEQALRKLIQPFDKTRIFKDSMKMSVAQLQQKIPQLNWLDFIQTVTNNSLYSADIITSEDYVIVIHDMEYLKNIISLVESVQFSKRTLANFIGWVVVQNLFATIPGVFQKYSEFVGAKNNETMVQLKRLCYESISKNFALSLSYLYVNSMPDYNTQDTDMLIQYLKNAFKKLVLKANWLDHETKSRVFSKLDAMVEVVGYPKILNNVKKLNELFQTFPNLSSNALQNYIIVNRFFVKREIEKLRMHNSKAEWIPPKPISEVGAYYMVHRNALVFPLSTHNPPFYYKDGPWYLNFGAIGSIIGHEITHGFDKIGHERDESGSLHNWWSNFSLIEYDKRSQCFQDQFNNYEIKGMNKSVNGTRTLSENIADSGGLRQSYVAYKTWEKHNGIEKRYPGFEQFTPDQMFFISFASVWCTKVSVYAKNDIFEEDIHSPPFMRVLGSVSNSEDFAKAFNCKKREPMNPENKCVLW